ncbi:hypothetical protein [Thiomicrorhabdus aquaedulcis]|uniref:hypothetical protein n=1 Tax=Thiomicrorhabdus aquaedulcis TaxID=2211106 RepID=UPI000FDC0FF5|nr:hypothetical protein [Thiomicrorhabdus aquaedulcis]
MHAEKTINYILSEGTAVYECGLSSYSRVQLGRLLGLSQPKQFDRLLVQFKLGCWMLGLLNEKALESHSKFINQHVLVESKEEGGQLRTQPLFDVHAIIKKLEPRLKIVSPEFFIQLLNEASLDRMENMLKNEATLFPSELANLNLMTLIPLESFRSFEAAVAEMLQTIERFRFEYNVLIKSLSSLFVDDDHTEKSLFWLKFFDHDSRSRAPTLSELIMVYERVKVLNEMSSDAIRELLKSKRPEMQRVRVFEVGKIKRLMDKEGINLVDVHHRLGMHCDIAQLYRVYQKWVKEGVYVEYWKRRNPALPGLVSSLAES